MTLSTGQISHIFNNTIKGWIMLNTVSLRAFPNRPWQGDWKESWSGVSPGSMTSSFSWTSPSPPPGEEGPSLNSQGHKSSFLRWPVTLPDLLERLVYKWVVFNFCHFWGGTNFWNCLVCELVFCHVKHRVHDKTSSCSENTLYHPYME